MGSSDGYLYALKREEGDGLLRFEVGDIVWSSVTATADGLFFGAHDGGVYHSTES